MPNSNVQPPFPSSPIKEDDFLMDELIVNPPGWLLRSGITVVFFAVLGGLLLSWIIKYPDKIEAPFILTSENPPITVVSKVSAVIDTLLYEDQMIVENGALMAIMESTANWQEIEKLENWLLSIQVLQSANSYTKIKPLKLLQIGKLKTPYAQLLQKIQELQYELVEQLTSEKVKAIQAEVNQIDQLNASLGKQENMFIKEIGLVKKGYERSKTLNEDKSVSDKELEVIESQFLQQERFLEGMRSGIIQNEIRKRQLNGQKLELIEVRQKDLELRFLAIQQSTSQLFESIEAWKELHHVHAPISGRLSHVEGLSHKQYIQVGKPIATLLPLSGRGVITGRAFVPPFNMGKIEIANDVHIRLDAYPDKEFGMIKAKVNKIASLPTKNEEGEVYYMMESHFSDSLSTTFNRSIPFKQQLNGTATIITKEKRLIQRLFENILNILNTN